MKKVDLEKELARIQKDGKVKKENNYLYVTFSIFLCLFCVVGILGFSFAMSNFETSKNEYTIKVDIENGYQSLYVKTVEEGAFSAEIDSDYQIGEIYCTKGNLKYDIQNRLIYNENVNSDIECKLTFNVEQVGIDLNELNEIADNDGISYYYPTNARNNYFKLNYMIFRIVRINGDGSYRLILNSSLENMTFGENTYDYSSINTYLKEWYNKNLINNDYILRKDYDTGVYNVSKTDFGKTLVNIGGYSLDYIGLLSANEILNINGSYTIVDDSYLKGTYLTMNLTDEGTVWAVNNGSLSPVLKTDVLGVRPVINVKAKSLVGDGTIDNPYMIEE